jgi:regulator of sigma E protease
VPVAFERSGRVIHTSLAIDNPGHRDDFDAETLGMLPKVQDQPVGIVDVPAGLPAAKAGLQPNDVIAGVDGHRFTYVRSIVAFLQQTGGHPVDLTINRGNQALHFMVQPMLDPGRQVYQLGFDSAQPPYVVERLSLPEAAWRSLATNVQYSGAIVEVLQKLFTKRNQIQNLSGPVGIGSQIHKAFGMPGWKPIISLTALISLNLGIFNLLPIPILDGGMILLLLIEGIRRRDLDQQLKERVYQVAFVVLVLFAVFVTFHDVSSFSIFSKPKP